MATSWDAIMVLKFPPSFDGKGLTCRGRSKSLPGAPQCCNIVNKKYGALAYATLTELSALAIGNHETDLRQNPTFQQLLSDLAEYSLCKRRHRKSTGSHSQHEEVIEGWHTHITHHQNILVTQTRTKHGQHITVVSTQIQDGEDSSMASMTRFTLPDPPQNIIRKPIALITPPSTPERSGSRAIAIEEPSTSVRQIAQMETPPDSEEVNRTRSTVFCSAAISPPAVEQLLTPPKTPQRRDRGLESPEADDDNLFALRMSATPNSTNPLLSSQRQLDIPETPTRSSRSQVSQIMQPPKTSMMDYTTERFEDGPLAERDMPDDPPESKGCLSLRSLWQACKGCFSSSA